MDAYINRGSAYDDMGFCDKAVSDFNKAIEINPYEPAAFSGRGLAYEIWKYHDRVIADFSTSIKLSPGDAEPYYHRGLAYYQKGEYGKSLSDYVKAESLGYKVEPQQLEEVKKALQGH